MDTALIPILIAVGSLIVFVAFIVLGIVRIVSARRKQKERASRPPGHFVFAKIIDRITPMERAAKYEKPLQKALTDKGYGFVTGGGTQLSRDKKVIEWVGLDIELFELGEAVNFTCNTLKELSVPPGSTLAYTVKGQEITVQIT